MPECPGALHFAHMHDGDMIRLRFPGGSLTASQLRYLAVLSEENGNGQIDLTNRANLQIRGLHDISQSQLASELKTEKILPKVIEADRLRNIMADPLRGKLKDGLTSTCPIVKKLDYLLQHPPQLWDLSPKFSFIIDNGSEEKIAQQAHDLALIATPIKVSTQFRLSIAQTKTDLYVRHQFAADFLIAITLAMHQTYPEHKRMGQLLDDIGLEAITAHIEQIYPDCERIAATEIQNKYPFNSNRQIPQIGMIGQSKVTSAALGLGIPVSRLTAQQCKYIAHLAETYGSGKIRLSPWQIIYILDIEFGTVLLLNDLVQTQGFITDQNFLDYQVFACSGGSGCPRTKALCKEDGRSLTAQLETFHPFPEMKPAIMRPTHPIKIHLSGCARGCAYAGEADILALAQPDGSGYAIYHNKSLANIRNSPNTTPSTTCSAKDPSDIVQTLLTRLRASLKMG